MADSTAAPQSHWEAVGREWLTQWGPVLKPSAVPVPSQLVHGDPDCPAAGMGGSKPSEKFRPRPQDDVGSHGRSPGRPGYLVAAYCYQDRLFDREVRDVDTSAMLGWRRRFRERLELIVARYPPRIAVDLDHLADMLSAIVEGGIVVAKVNKDKRALSQQLNAVPRIPPRGFSRRVNGAPGI
jgi:hypothetical protein